MELAIKKLGNANAKLVGLNKIVPRLFAQMLVLIEVNVLLKDASASLVGKEVIVLLKSVRMIVPGKENVQMEGVYAKLDIKVNIFFLNK